MRLAPSYSHAKKQLSGIICSSPSVPLVLCFSKSFCLLDPANIFKHPLTFSDLNFLAAESVATALILQFTIVVHPTLIQQSLFHCRQDSTPRFAGLPARSIRSVNLLQISICYYFHTFRQKEKPGQARLFRKLPSFNHLFITVYL